MSNLPLYAAPASGSARRAAESGKTYTIADLAREFGVSLRTLRFYEDRGLLSPVRMGTRRLYGESDRARLALILKGKQLGFTLTEIRGLLEREAKGEGAAAASLRLSPQQIDDQIAHLEAQQEEIERALAELRAQRKAMAC
jgi:DNA-binding transcriptional MerR regulator